MPDNSEIARSEIRYRRLFEEARDGILIVEPDTGRITDANPYLYELLGCPDKSLLGKELWEIGLFEDRDASRAAFLELHEVGYIRYENLPLAAFGGEYREVEFVSNVYSELDRSVIQCNIRDNSEAKRKQNELIESEYRLRLALECGDFGVWELDIASNEFLSITPKAKTLFGVSADIDCTWAACLELVAVEDLTKVQDRLAWSIQNRSTVEFEFRVKRSDGSRGWLHSFGGPSLQRRGSIDRIVGVVQDITERKLREAERETTLREVEYRANHDPLTGLLNHRAFYNNLDTALADAADRGRPLALAILDLDNFKFFNDAYGHRVGDEVLRSVAYRLQSTCRPSDALGRFGGDEFAVLFTGIDVQENGTAPIASLIETSLQVRLQGLDYHPQYSESGIPITISVGVYVWFPDRPANADFSFVLQEIVELADHRLRIVKTGTEIEGEAQRIRIATGQQIKGFPILDALVASVENKDRYTRRHSEDVMSYSLLIARELGIDEASLQTIAIAALVHDVGKIGVPDAILT